MSKSFAGGPQVQNTPDASVRYMLFAAQLIARLDDLLVLIPLEV